MPAPKKTKKGRAWQEIACEAQAIRDQTLADVEATVTLPPRLPTNVITIPEKILSQGNIRITSLSPQHIVSLTSHGKLSAQEVVQAFLERAVVAQKLVSKPSNKTSTQATKLPPKQYRVAYKPIAIDELRNWASTPTSNFPGYRA